MIPTVAWNGVRISRLLVGHNPFKGQSHFNGALDEEMREWFEDREHILDVLKRCEEVGITTAQFGGEVPMWALAEHQRRGGKLDWIATMYGHANPDPTPEEDQAWEKELRSILAHSPAPLGIQHFGEMTERLYFAGRLDIVRERMKRLRDTGLLIGVGTHLAEVVEEMEEQGWDVDFYQTCFYACYSGNRRGVNRDQEVFEDEDRDKMVKAIQQASKPCLAFKVLGGNRKCGTPEEVRAALEYTYASLKPTDVACVGMWQKYMDQVGWNARVVGEILGEAGD